MASIRSFLLATALPLSLLACGGDDGGGGTVTPEGDHYQYVSSRVFVPENNNQSREYGLDLNGDNTVDNQLGMVLGTLATMGFEIQATVDEAVSEGSIILLVDFQTTDFTNAGAAGLKVLLGATPMPQPCTDPLMPTPATCGQHLTGTGSFTINPASPSNAAVAGKIVNGSFTGGPGEITLQIALGGADAITLNLVGARAKASGITADGMTSVVFGGAITEDQLNSEVIPAIAAQLEPTIAGDCTDRTNPTGGCGCMAGSTGKTVLDLFDSMPKDCTVTALEIQNNSLIQSLLAPDVTIDGMPALSLGIKAEGKKATFPAQN